MFRAPRGRTPALGSGQGVYRRDRATQIPYVRKTCAPVPRPVSHLTAAAAAARDRFLRLPKAINTKFEITFGRTFGFVIEESRTRTKVIVISNLVFIDFPQRGGLRRSGSRPKWSFFSLLCESITHVSKLMFFTRLNVLVCQQVNYMNK